MKLISISIFQDGIRRAIRFGPAALKGRYGKSDQSNALPLGAWLNKKIHKPVVLSFVFFLLTILSLDIYISWQKIIQHNSEEFKVFLKGQVHSIQVHDFFGVQESTALFCSLKDAYFCDLIIDKQHDVARWQQHPQYGELGEYIDRKKSKNWFVYEGEFILGQVVQLENVPGVGVVTFEIALPSSRIYYPTLLRLAVLLILSFFMFLVLYILIVQSVNQIKNEIGLFSQRVSSVSSFSEYQKNKPLALSILEIQKLEQVITNLLAALNEKELEEKIAFRNKALSKQIQLVAHDIRRPFSLLTIMMNSIEKTSNIDSFKNLIGKLRPSLKSSMLSIDAMLHDISSLNSLNSFELNPFSMVGVIERCLEESTQIHFNHSFTVRYIFNHQHKVLGNDSQMARAVANILSNGLQAMAKVNTESCFDFRSREVGDSIIFSIGNNGSGISKSVLRHLFDPFFTLKKSTGIGLGLASAKNIVEACNGKILCKSPGEHNDVEFEIHLKKAGEREDNYDNCFSPESYRSLAEHFQAGVKTSLGAKDSFSSLDDEDYQIGVLDDEEIFTDSFKEMVQKGKIGEKCQCSVFHDPDLFLNSDFHKYQLIICDLDLQNLKNGFQVTTQLRNQGFKGVIVIHTNLTHPDIAKKSMQAGADFIIPKPINEIQLINLMTERHASITK